MAAVLQMASMANGAGGAATALATYLYPLLPTIAARAAPAGEEEAYIPKTVAQNKPRINARGCTHAHAHFLVFWPDAWPATCHGVCELDGVGAAAHTATLPPPPRVLATHNATRMAR